MGRRNKIKKEETKWKRAGERGRGEENASQCNEKENENDRGNSDFVFCIHSLVIYRVDIYISMRNAPPPKPSSFVCAV